MLNIKKYYFIFAIFTITVTLFGITGTPLAHAQDPSPDCFHGNFESGLITGSICDFIGPDAATSLVRFMQLIVNLVTSLIVALGLISIVIGGYFYMTAGGSADRIGTAKTWIISALLGIILALASWLILNTISGQFTDPEIPLPSPVAAP